MKRLAGVLLLSIVMMVPALCRGQEKTEGKMKSLVVYYSFSGNTEAAAQALAGEIGADIVKIEDPAPLSKLKAYFAGSFAAMREKSWPIKQVSVSVAPYERIFVGAPVWAGKCAPQVNTFIDQTDLTGKTAVVFVTIGNSDPAKALAALEKKIVAKGGKTVSSFSIKTGGVKKEDITAKAREIATNYK